MGLAMTFNFLHGTVSSRFVDVYDSTTIRLMLVCKFVRVFKVSPNVVVVCHIIAGRCVTRAQGPTQGGAPARTAAADV